MSRASTSGGGWRPGYASTWSWGVRSSSSFLWPLHSVLHPFSGSRASPDSAVPRPPLAWERAVDFPVNSGADASRHRSHSAADTQRGCALSRQITIRLQMFTPHCKWMNERERKKRYSTRLECLTLSVVTLVHWWDSWHERVERTPMPSAPPTSRDRGEHVKTSWITKGKTWILFNWLLWEAEEVHLLQQESLLLAPLASRALTFGPLLDKLLLQRPHHVSHPPVLSSGCGTTFTELQSLQNLGHGLLLFFHQSQPWEQYETWKIISPTSLRIGDGG